MAKTAAMRDGAPAPSSLRPVRIGFLGAGCRPAASPGRVDRLGQDPDVGQVPVVVVEVEPVTDDELVGDGEAAVIGLERDHLAAELAQQHGRADAGRAAIFHPFHQGDDRSAGVQDVVEQQHVAAGDVGRTTR